jgi:predicted metal-dependent peptidase
MGALAVVFDVSGSVCDPATLAAFMGELQAAVDDASPDQVEVIQCNTKITKRTTFRHGDLIEVVLKGGGGTDMQPALDVIEGAAACIVFTDCEFPRDPIDTHGVPTLWAKWGTYNGRHVPTWGEVIQLP